MEDADHDQALRRVAGADGLERGQRGGAEVAALGPPAQQHHLAPQIGEADGAAAHPAVEVELGGRLTDQYRPESGSSAGALAFPARRSVEGPRPEPRRAFAMVDRRLPCIQAGLRFRYMLRRNRYSSCRCLSRLVVGTPSARGQARDRDPREDPIMRIRAVLLAVALAVTPDAASALPKTLRYVDPQAPCFRWPAVDMDGDGVFDRVDHCVNTPRGLRRRRLRLSDRRRRRRRLRRHRPVSLDARRREGRRVRLLGRAGAVRVRVAVGSRAGAGVAAERGREAAGRDRPHPDRERLLRERRGQAAAGIRDHAAGGRPDPRQVPGAAHRDPGPHRHSRARGAEPAPQPGARRGGARIPARELPARAVALRRQGLRRDRGPRRASATTRSCSAIAASCSRC